MSDAADEAGTRPSATEDLADLYEHAPCGYLSLSPDGIIVKSNATFSAWCGFETESLIGRLFRDLLTGAGRMYYETHLVPLLRMQATVSEVALDIVTRAQNRLSVILNAAERRDQTGKLLFIRITVIDATDRRRYERDLLESRKVAEAGSEQLRLLNESLEARVEQAVKLRLAAEDSLRQGQKMEALGQLTGGIAHDFNNLLAGILGSLDLLSLRVRQGRSDTIPRYLVAAQGAAKRAAVLTHRLLEFARHRKLEPRAVDVDRLIADMAELVRRTLGQAVRLEVVGAGGVWPTVVDANQLENALLNLCINARDAMPDGGRLTIETANKWLDERGALERELTPGQYVAVSVSDTGSGMPPEVIAQAFDPFFTTKPVGVGTGLGLAMVHGFARQSGGQVSIYSEVGSGTTISIYLPRHRGDVTEEAAIAAPEDPFKAAAREDTILVVDDEPTVRMLLTEVLEECGYHVIEASDGPAALKILDSTVRIDLLITDVGLPGGLSGPQMVAAARLTRDDLKVLFVTGYADNAVSGNGPLRHGDQILHKPFSIDELTKKARHLLPDR